MASPDSETPDVMMEEKVVRVELVCMFHVPFSKLAESHLDQRSNLPSRVNAFSVTFFRIDSNHHIILFPVSKHNQARAH